MELQLRSGRVPHALHIPIDSPDSGVLFLGFVLAAAGCSCGGDSMIAQVPITVSLTVSPVVVPQDGTQVIVPTEITSIGRYRTGSVSYLPSGLQEKYAASDKTPPDRSSLPQYCDPGRHFFAGHDGELGRANRVDELHFGSYGATKTGNANGFDALM